jgi:endonuclease III related protein
VPQSVTEQQIISVYSTLSRAWGRQHWWPARSRFEVIVGAYLTQNTNWTNVEIALRKLRSAGVLSVAGIRDISLSKLEVLVRSSGYFRQKARRLKVFVKFLDQNYGGSLNRMFAQPTAELREQLLALNGVGPETADSILLYAGQHPVFVVDAYTKRIAGRHGILPETAKYEDFRLLFERTLSRGPKPATDSSDLLRGAGHRPSRMSLAARIPLAQVFNEMHGLLVGVGRNHCLKSRPRCDLCPLKPLLPQPQPQNTGL